MKTTSLGLEELALRRHCPENWQEIRCFPCKSDELRIRRVDGPHGPVGYYILWMLRAIGSIYGRDKRSLLKKGKARHHD
jgi:hypothetical protein